MKFINKKTVLPPLFIMLWLLLILTAVYLKKPYFWYPSGELATMSQKATEQGNYTHALDLIREAITSEQEEPGYFIMAGNLEIVLKQYSKAEISFKRALMLSPSEAEALIGLTEVYIKTGNRRNKELTLRKISFPELTPEQQYRIVQLKAVDGDFKTALSMIDQLITSQGSSERNLTRAFKYAAASENWNYIMKHSSEIISTNRNRDKLFSIKAMALRIKGKKKESYDLYTQNATQSNLIPRIELAVELEYFDDAIPLLKEGIKKYPSLIKFRSQLAYVLMKQNRVAESIVEYAELVKNKNLSSDDRIRYTWVLNRAGKHKKAWEIISSYEPDPLNTPGLELKARTAFWAGEMESASKYLKKVIELKEKK